MNPACFILFNPVSGKGKGQRVAQQLQAELASKGFLVRCCQTTPDMNELKRQCADIRPEEKVVVIGGDGTLLDYLNHRTATNPVAFFGMGTANVVSIEYRIPRKVQAFATMLAQGNTTQVRLGKLQDGTRFLMMASFGIDAAIVGGVSQRLKNRLGKFAFVPPFLKALWHYDYSPIELALDDGPTQRFAFVVLCRFKHYGGAAVMARQADAASDLIHVVGLKRSGVLGLLGLGIKFLWRQLGKTKGLPCQATRSVRMTTSAPCQLDGSFHVGPVEHVTVCPNGFELIVP